MLICTSISCKANHLNITELRKCQIFLNELWFRITENTKHTKIYLEDRYISCFRYTVYKSKSIMLTNFEFCLFILLIILHGISHEH